MIRRCHPGVLLALAAALRVGSAAAALPNYDEAKAQPLDHLTVAATAEADPVTVALIGELCDRAAGVYEQELKLPPPPNPRVLVASTKSVNCSVVTDRLSRVFVTYSPKQSILLGRDWQPIPNGPVFLLCRAVAELYNPHRIPGLEQLLASRYAVPAILEQLGPKAWLKAYPIDETDGRACLKQRSDDSDYLLAHPRWAAAVGLQRVIDKLKPAGLVKTLAAVKGEGRPALARLRKLLVAQDADLDRAFTEWDRATDLPTDGDGSLLLSSFETAEQCALWTKTTILGCRIVPQTTWATDGKRCGVFTFQPAPWPQACLYEPDWRYADWTSFNTLEFDVKNPGEASVDLRVSVYDEWSNGHGMIVRAFNVPPREPQHYVIPLNDPTVQAPGFGVYYSGHLRLDEIADLKFTVPSEKAPAPTVLWFDNVRLKP